MRKACAILTLVGLFSSSASAAAPAVVIGADALAVQDGMPDGDADMPDGDDDMDFSDEPGEADLFVDDSDILAPADASEKKKPKKPAPAALKPAPVETPPAEEPHERRLIVSEDDEEEEAAPPPRESLRSNDSRRATLEETTTLRLDPEEPGLSEFDSATMGLIAGGGAVAAVVVVAALVGGAVVTSDLVLGLWGIPGLGGGETGSVTVTPK